MAGARTTAAAPSPPRAGDPPSSGGGGAARRAQGWRDRCARGWESLTAGRSALSPAPRAPAAAPPSASWSRALRRSRGPRGWQRCRRRRPRPACRWPAPASSSPRALGANLHCCAHRHHAATDAAQLARDAITVPLPLTSPLTTLPSRPTTEMRSEKRDKTLPTCRAVDTVSLCGRAGVGILLLWRRIAECKEVR